LCLLKRYEPTLSEVFRYLTIIKGGHHLRDDLRLQLIICFEYIAIESIWAKAFIEVALFQCSLHLICSENYFVGIIIVHCFLLDYHLIVWVNIEVNTKTSYHVYRSFIDVLEVLSYDHVHLFLVLIYDNVISFRPLHFEHYRVGPLDH